MSYKGPYKEAKVLGDRKAKWMGSGPPGGRQEAVKRMNERNPDLLDDQSGTKLPWTINGKP
jgi:hypothetical protein